MKTKILNDPVYGFIRLPTPLIFELVEHRWFQRLRRIKQVGLTHYVYPGALHTRFHHALGAMHLMHRAITTIQSKGTDISPEDAESAMIAILLHDIGHGPYSHTLERVLINRSHEALTLAFMRRLNEEFGGRLEGAISIFEGTHPRKFLNQLVSGQLDLDRMDYLKRDSFFTGVAEGNIGHDRIIYMLDVVDDEIVVEVKGLFSIEQFLFARKLMYWQVYLHKTSLAAEVMLRQAIVLIREGLERGVGYPELPDPLAALLMTDHPGDPVSDEILDHFALIDDYDIICTLKGLAHSNHRVLKFLSDRLLNRRLFATEMLDTEPDKKRIGSLVRGAADVFNFTEQEAKHLVVQGFEAIPTYKTSHDEIMMLLKSGEILPFSELRTIHQDAVTHQHFLSYPKELRDTV